MSQWTLKPNFFLAFATAMTVPWLFVGINFFGYSLLLTMLFPLLDIPFWSHFAQTGFRDKKSHNWFFISGSLLFLWVGWQSPSLLRLFLKFGLLAIFLKYIISILEFYGPKPFTYSYRTACLMTIVQFIGANSIRGFYFFEPKSLIVSITRNLTLGTGVDAGEYFGVHLWSDLIRVGGTALEPGHMALIAAVFAPFLMKTFPDRLLLVGAIFASLSKVSFFQLLILIWGWLTIYILRSGFLWLSIMVAYVAGTYLLNTYYFSSPLELFAFNPSIYERLHGAILFLKSDIKFALLGNGYLGICDNIDLATIVSEQPTGFSKLATGSTICTLGVHSVFGSFLVESGIIGALGLGIGLTLFEKKRITAPRALGMPIQMIPVLILCGLTSVHWLTNLPPVYVAIALLLADLRGSNHAVN